MVIDMQKEVQWLLEEKYHQKPTKQFKADVKKLKNGEPLDYLIGFTEFLGCKIDLSKRPLIPRFETEYWVENAIEYISNPSARHARSGQNLRILDMFSGSGCIGIAVLAHVKNSTLEFAEKDKNLLEQIKINCKVNKIPKKRYKILQSDVFDGIKGKYDYIFANPPYIPIKRKNKVQKSVLEHEPELALFGGGDGLFYIREFLRNAQSFLKPKGKIFMEFDSIQKKDIGKLLKIFRYKKYAFCKDQYGKWRYLVVG